VTEPFAVTSKTIRKIQWDVGAKVLAQVAPQANVTVNTQGSHKGDLDFEFDDVSTSHCSDRLAVSEALMRPGLLPKTRLDALNSNYVWVVVQTISIGKFTCKATGENKGLFQAKATVGGAAGAAAPASGELTANGWSSTDTTLNYDNHDHPLVVAFVCLRFQVKDGNLVKPVFVSMGEEDGKAPAAPIEPQQWFDAAEFSQDGAPPYFTVEDKPH